MKPEGLENQVEDVGETPTARSHGAHPRHQGRFTLSPHDQLLLEIPEPTQTFLLRGNHRKGAGLGAWERELSVPSGWPPSWFPVLSLHTTRPCFCLSECHRES